MSEVVPKVALWVLRICFKNEAKIVELLLKWKLVQIWVKNSKKVFNWKVFFAKKIKILIVQIKSIKNFWKDWGFLINQKLINQLPPYQFKV